MIRIISSFLLLIAMAPWVFGQSKSKEGHATPPKAAIKNLLEECARIGTSGQLKRGVELAATSLITAIRDKDERTVLRLIRPDGQGLGFFNIGQQFVPHEVLESDFAAKKAYYCRFFDTECWRSGENKQLWAAEESMRGHEYSYREWLTLSQAKRLQVEIIGTAYCQASVRIFPAQTSSRPFFPSALDWGWIYEGDGWKLLASGYTFVDFSTKNGQQTKRLVGKPPDRK